ncbi:ATP-binding cassette domain-containing protein [Companilactobacillus allii]|uniref:Multidrug ABC transporter ATP-binding protein n=1 Tax=Companilactobacillus allii TaxID=1847728 RepID=A0A1P8Q161_9LACO|nr:ABC-F family ATP-binding cassette domain-containing protein [Companilactobacillus allii]APX71600.1 multidrug ABC transporter ATP-binding protein [Companilactobacillus allii]USQ68682.1 ATP-binding cassette domain-containing protein [Companilactobacillus allii]
MSVLEVHDLTQQFLDKKLYDDASLQVNKEDHLGITGQNGVGKSTFIKILTGQIEPDEGKITWQKHLTVGYLDQQAKLVSGMTIKEYLQTAFANLYEANDKLTDIYMNNPTDDDLEKAGKLQEILDANNFYELDTQIEQVATGLGLDAIGYDHDVSQLSGGQRSKIILAKILLEKPDMILLDEPTNYLDTNHIEWLSAYLNDFEGAFIVISHDYNFLDKIVNCVADIEFGKITKYTGNLKQVQKQKSANKETYMKAYVKQQEKIAKTKAYIRKFKAGTRSKSAKSREKQLSHMDVLTPPGNKKIGSFGFPYQEIPSSRMLLEVNDLKIGYDKALFEQELNFSIVSGEKMVIKGFNGIGKSTLIKTLLGQIKPIYGDFDFSEVAKIGYFKQDLVWKNNMETPFQIVSRDHPDKDGKEIRRVLARTGLTNQQIMSNIRSLSGGEQTKVKLADLMFDPTNFLFMDEPTNHLDDESKAALRKGLRNFDGSMILVTHEEDFYSSDWIDKVLDIEEIKKN